MAFDVNKIIEESVQNVIDSDKEETLTEDEHLEENDKKEKNDGTEFITEDEFKASKDFLIESVKDVDGKK